MRSGVRMNRQSEKAIVKTRRRLVFLMIIIYLLMMSLIIGLINYANYKSNQKEVGQVLSQHLQFLASHTGTQSETPANGFSWNQSSLYSMTDIYTVRKNDGAISLYDASPTSSLTEGQILRVGRNIAALTETSGRYRGYQYLVQKEDTASSLITFVNVKLLIRQEQLLLLRSVLLVGGILIMWIFFSLFLVCYLTEPMQKAMTAQSDFIAMASHELKTPLTVITSSLYMMRNEGIDSRYLGYAEDEAERMRKLVLQLLDLSKLEHQRQPFDVFDMSEAVEGIVLPFESLAYEQDIDLSYDIEESIRVKGVRQEIEQLTAILTENAVRHTDREQKVRISLQKSGGSCLLEVKNQGQEIPQEERAKIFDKFYQAADSKGSPKAGYEGNYGLGLAIAQTVASRHFSKIKVRCEDGWNIFSIRLPAQS